MTTQNNGRPPKSLSVRILDKEYHIACPPGAEAELQLSAQYLDKQMKSIRRTGKVVGLERIAIMAGLNTAYALLKATRSAVTPEPVNSSDAALSIDTPSPLVNERLTELKNRIDEALAGTSAVTTNAPHTHSLNRGATHDLESLLWPEEENSLQVSALEVEY
jgi:cell division protein ZapA